MEVIKQAAVIFPILAVVITLPYLIYNYRKHGSVMSLRVPIVYSFVLYLLCCYFLVILPLPSQDYVASLSGPRTQLIPFTFITDMASSVDPISQIGLGGVVVAVLKSRAFYQVVMNLLMFIPLGIYLRYYFRCSLKRTLIISLALSLFFELTQLSGLYFIYPRGYRLFDVDDLIVNTLGGLVGYVMAGPLAKILPTRADIDKGSYRRSQKVSLLRRMVALFCDFVAIIVISILVGIVVGQTHFQMPNFSFVAYAGLIIFGYFGVLPSVMNSQTIGHKLTRLQVARLHGGPARWYQHLGRALLLLSVFVILPQLLVGGIYWMYQMNYVSSDGALVLGLAVAAIYVMILLVELIRAAIRKPLFYERWTRTKIISTTSIKPKNQTQDNRKTGDSSNVAYSKLEKDD